VVFAVSAASVILLLICTLLLNNFVERQLRHIYLDSVQTLLTSLEEGVKVSLERGQMKNFKRLIRRRKQINGVREITLFDRTGAVAVSSLSKKERPADLTAETLARLRKNPKPVQKRDGAMLRILAPQIVVPDCIRCHPSWEKGGVGGVISLTYDLTPLNTAITRLHIFIFVGALLLLILIIVLLKAIMGNIRDLDQKVILRTDELEHQRRYVSAIMDSQSSIVITTDGKAIRTANKAFMDFYAVTSLEEFISTYGDCICDTFEEGHDGFITKVYKGERWIYYILDRPDETHKAIILRNGRKHIFTMVAHKFQFDDELLITAVFSDISDIEHIKDELEIAKDRAEESARLKSEFLANMSHEIRTPMNGIIGMSHLVLQTELADKQRHYIKRIDNSAKSLLGIINDILDFSKIEAGKLNIEMVNFDLFVLIADIINLLEFKAHEKKLELIVDYDINVGKNFFGDSLRIGQILTNLLTNAIKFTDKGEIAIIVRRLDDGRMRFEVRDSGVGLSRKQQAKLFKSFSQADSSTTRKYGGTGLGLAISRQLVELMDGRIWVESEPGRGSNFIFEIALPPEETNKQVFTIFSDKRALVVDDNQSWRDILRHLLTSFGLQVDCVESGTAAIERLRDRADDYDLALVDWNMPGLNGIETAQRIKTYVAGETNIILVSAFKLEDLTAAAAQAGIKTFLQKPVNPSVLNDILSDLFLGTSKAFPIERNEKKTLKYNIQTLRGSRILLTEDNRTNQEIITGLLEDSGIIMDIANNGAEAVEMARSNNYELILMDLQMPVMDGYQATRIIRERDKDVPIIALTANAMRADIERTQAALMNRHLNKPIDVEKLYATLLEYISKKTDEIKTTAHQGTDIELPEFEHIDKDYALNLVLGDKKIFVNILKGMLEYKNIDLAAMEAAEFKRATHTLKGISASAGAMELHRLAKRLDETGDRSLLPDFYSELAVVCGEIEAKIIPAGAGGEKAELSAARRDELFSQLREAIASRRAKNCKPVMAELERYELSGPDRELYAQIKPLLKKFKFKQALELL
jgi:signal transduction histidine kinase/CheY-like chemotaxis protein